MDSIVLNSRFSMSRSKHITDKSQFEILFLQVCRQNSEKDGVYTFKLTKQGSVGG